MCRICLGVPYKIHKRVLLIPRGWYIVSAIIENWAWQRAPWDCPAQGPVTHQGRDKMTEILQIISLYENHFDSNVIAIC